MVSWILVIVGLAVVAYAAAFGIVSWEVTLGLIAVGLGAAAFGGWTLIRSGHDTLRRPSIMR